MALQLQAETETTSDQPPTIPENTFRVPGKEAKQHKIWQKELTLKSGEKISAIFTLSPIDKERPEWDEIKTQLDNPQNAPFLKNWKGALTTQWVKCTAVCSNGRKIEMIGPKSNFTDPKGDKTSFETTVSVDKSVEARLDQFDQNADKTKPVKYIFLAKDMVRPFCSTDGVIFIQWPIENVSMVAHEKVHSEDMFRFGGTSVASLEEGMAIHFSRSMFPGGVDSRFFDLNWNGDHYLRLVFSTETDDLTLPLSNAPNDPRPNNARYYPIGQLFVESLLEFAQEAEIDPPEKLLFQLRKLVGTKRNNLANMVLGGSPVMKDGKFYEPAETVVKTALYNLGIYPEIIGAKMKKLAEKKWGELQKKKSLQS